MAYGSFTVMPILMTGKGKKFAEYLVFSLLAVFDFLILRASSLIHGINGTFAELV